MDYKLSQQHAIVTGAARGIGFAIAEHLAAEGVRVTLCDINFTAAEEAANRLQSLGYHATAFAADVASEEQIDALVSHAEEIFGPVDILVNNAGIISKGPVTEVGLAQWQQLIATDVTSVFLLTKALVAGMMARKRGRIINIASIAGQQGGGLLGNTCYAAAKGAVIAFTKGIAQEAGSAGVTCNVICPGYTETALTSTMTEAQQQHVLSGIPLARPGKPADIASAVTFLASAEAAFISGVTLNVDGGFMRY